MSRLSREKKREQKHAGGPAAAVAPLDVHVRGGGTATISGVPVAAVEGEEIQRAVLGHLHRIALATGHPVLATVHDERIGYVVPLRVEADGSSHFTAEPLRTAMATAASTATATQTAPSPQAPPAPPVAREAMPEAHAARLPAAPPVADAERPSPPRHDAPTHFLRPVAEPVRDAAPTFPLRAVPEPQPERKAEAERAPEPTTREPAHERGPAQEPVQAPVRDAAPEPAQEPTPEPAPQDDVPALGTVTAPTGVFGPPPAMDERPAPEAAVIAPPPAPAPLPAPTPLPFPPGASAPEPTPLVPEGLVRDRVSDPDPDSRPTPARGFDAVAEAVLGDDPRTLHDVGGVPALLGEPIAQINEAVRAGRIDAASALAERTVLEASGTLGPEHPEVLRLRELMAYIAYLGGDPLRAFHVSLDLARIRRRDRDAEAAYGNVQSAAAAWRAVRDPRQGLNLGTELLGLWTELTTEEGPAADDVEELESARARMLRLADRARTAGA